VVTDDAVGGDGGQAGEQEQQPVLRRLNREISGHAQGKDNRQYVYPVEASFYVCTKGQRVASPTIPRDFTHEQLG
jgi:hypothetical protein